jgi:putative PIN family toxin of toxin-antitoxin system
VLRVVIDSNVWVSGLIRPTGPPGQILEAVLEEQVHVVASWELVEEIAAVLSRPKLARYHLAATDVLDLLQMLARTLPTVDVRVELRDPDDAPVGAAAVAGRADVVVTGDADLLANEELRDWLSERGVRVLTPRELTAEIGRP